METILKQIEPRTAIMVMISTALLIAAALGTYVIWPEIKEYRTSLTTYNVLNQVSRNGEALDKQIASLKLDVESLDHELHGDLANLPEKQIEAFIIGQLQSISWRNNIELQSVRPGKGNVISVFEEIVFNVQITGDYFDLYSWLHELGDELGFVVVKRFAIRPLDRNKAESRLTADLTIVTYREVGDV